MQEQTIQASSGKLPVKFTVTVTVIKSNRVPCILGMNADLMCSPCYRTGFDQRSKLVTLLNLKARFRRFTLRIHTNNALTALQNILEQRSLHNFAMRLPLPTNQCQVIFLHTLQTQLFMQ